MKRITLFLLSAMLSSSASAAGFWSPYTLTAGSCSKFTWGSGDTADAQPSINVPPGELAFTTEIASGSPSVAFYTIPADSATPASTGILAYTATATSRTPTYISTGGGYVLDPDVDTASSGGTMTVCSAGYSSAGAKRNPGFAGAWPAGTVTSADWCPGGNVVTLYQPSWTFPYKAGAWACRITAGSGGVSLWNVVVAFDRDLLPAANIGFEARLDPALQAAIDYCLGPVATSGFDANQEHKCQIDAITDTYEVRDAIFVQSATSKPTTSLTIDLHGSTLLHVPSNISGGTAGYESSTTVSGLPATWSRGDWWIITDAQSIDDITVGGKASKTIGTIVADAVACNQQWGTPTIRVDTTAAHNLADGSTAQRLGDLIEISGTTNYNGIEYVRQIIDADTFCYVQNNSSGSGTESAGTVAPMKSAAYATGPNTTADSRQSGGAPFFVIGGDATQLTTNVTLRDFNIVFSITQDPANNELPWRQRGVLVVGTGGGASNIRVEMVACSTSNEMAQTCFEVISAGGNAARNISFNGGYLDSGPDFGSGSIRIRGNASNVSLFNNKGGHGGGRLDIGDDVASSGDALPSGVTAFNYGLEGCGTYCLKMSGGQLTIVGGWIAGDVDGPQAAGARKVDPGFIGWIGGATNTDADFSCFGCELIIQNMSNLTTASPYIAIGKARRIEWSGGYMQSGNEAGARIFGAGIAAASVGKLILDVPTTQGSGSLIDYTNFTSTTLDHPLHYDINVKTPATSDDILIGRIDRHSHLGRLDCIAHNGASLTTIDQTVNECNTNGASCASTGLAATMTVVDTLVSDTSATDNDIAAGNWLKLITGTVTWTTPGHTTCTLTYRSDN